MLHVDIPKCIRMPGSCEGSPPLSVMDTRVDLHLSFPQVVSLCDGPHLLQEEAIGTHDQDILVDLCKPARLRAQCNSHGMFCIIIQSKRLRVISIRFLACGQYYVVSHLSRLLRSFSTIVDMVPFQLSC